MFVVVKGTYDERLFRTGIDLSGENFRNIHNVQNCFDFFFCYRRTALCPAYLHFNSSLLF